MTDVFRTLGKFWVANITATLGFVVGVVGFPITLGVLAGLPVIPPELASLSSLAFYAGLVTAALGWAWVMAK